MNGAYITEGINIHHVDYPSGNKTHIGVLNEAYKAMKTNAEETLKRAETLYEEKEKYYNRLVELGDIVKPKTQEEINMELIATSRLMMDELLANRELMGKLIEENKSLKEQENGYKCNVEKGESNGSVSRKNK